MLKEMTFLELKQERKLRKISLRDLAKAIGLSYAHVAKVERQEKTFDVNQLRKYRQYIATHDNRKKVA